MERSRRDHGHGGPGAGAHRLLRLLVVVLAVGGMMATECPGTWEARTPPPFPETNGQLPVTALADGRVIVVGSQGGRPASSIYDPADDSWSVPELLPLLPMPGLTQTEGGSDPDLPETLVLWPESLTAMPDGQVIAISNGGRFWAYPDGGQQPTERMIMAALHWGPDGWSLGGTLENTIYGFAASRLGDDRIVAVGGTDMRGNPAGADGIIYAPSTRSWTSVIPPVGEDVRVGILGMTATRLADGRVLVAGGSDRFGALVYAGTGLIDLDGSWRPGPSLATGRGSHAAALLPDGSVIIAGGGTGWWDVGSAIDHTSVEIWSPSAPAWRAAPSSPGPIHHAVMIAGGRLLAVASDGATAVFDPASAKWCTTSAHPGDPGVLVATGDGAALAFSASSTARFTLAPVPPEAATLDITEVRWRIVVEADAVRVGGSMATATPAGWEATTALPGAGDHEVTIEWRAGAITRTATATAAEVIVPLGGG